MTQQSLSDLQAELAEIRQKVANLEAKQDNSKPTTNSARRRGFSKSLIFGLLALMGGLLLISTVLYGQGANPFALFIDKDGNVGIGTTEPKATLDVAGHLNVSDSATLSNAAITGSLMTRGNVGIGTVSPKANLDVQQGVRTGAHPDAVKGLYVTGDLGPDSGVEFRHSNGTQGIGFGYNTIYATGGNTAQDLNLKPRGNGLVNVQGPLKIKQGWVPAVPWQNVKIRFGYKVLDFLPSGFQTLTLAHGEQFQNRDTYFVIANVSELHEKVGADVYTTYESHPISGTEFIVRWSRTGGRTRQVVINWMVIGY